MCLARHHLRRGIDGESKLGLLAVVDGQALEEQGPEAGAGPATDGVEHQETLEPGAVVGELADAVEAQVHDLLADGVVAAREVVRGVLLAGDQLLGMEQGPGQKMFIITVSLLCLPCRDPPVGAGPGLVHHAGLEVHEDGPGHVLAVARLLEEGGEGVVPGRLVAGHHTWGGEHYGY